jgi:hypothetical protein
MKKFLALGLGLLLIYNLTAQGCSDAGVCSIGGLKGDGNEENGYAALNLQYGIGEQNVRVFTPQLEAVFKLHNKSNLQLKLPYVFASGNLGAVNGIGDISLVGTYRFYDKNKWKIGFNLGFKLGVNAADKKTQIVNSDLSPFLQTSSYSAPMPYQTSLGTHDLLIGFDAKYNKKWILGLGFQMPLYQFNKNSFDTALANPVETEKKQYFTSAQLFRRPDIVLRIDRQFILIKEKLVLQAGILPIYHLGHDRITDRSGVSHAISGSKGLTFNITSAISYQLNKRFSLIARYASPLIVRKVRPDGLTRHYVSGLELRYSF